VFTRQVGRGVLLDAVRGRYVGYRHVDFEYKEEEGVEGMRGGGRGEKL
jgi:hypothetical protein